MEIRDLFSVAVRRPDAEVYRASRDRWDSIAKPIDGLGDMEDMVSRIASMQGRILPDLSHKALIVMCADNGVVAEGVSQCPQSVTADVARLLGSGRSTVCTMTKEIDVDVIPVDIGIAGEEALPGVVNRKVCAGTGNIAVEPAMSRKQCMQAIETGREMMEKCKRNGYGLIATGEMGIGNTTTATALLCALTGTAPGIVAGRGAGLSDEGLRHKTEVIGQALEHHGLDSGREIRDPNRVFEALQTVGGLDIAGLAGLFIGGAEQGIPVIIDGVVCAVAALTAEYLVPGTSAYMIASHYGRERGISYALDRLKCSAVIDADLALGEGTGAVMLFPLLDMAMSLYQHGIRFDDTEITAYKRYGSK